MDDARELATLAETDLHLGSLLIAPIPRLASSPSAERASKVHSGSALAELLRVLVGEFEGISLRYVRKILEITLTAWLPTILHVQGGSCRVIHTGFEGQRSEMRSMIPGVVAGFSSTRRDVLLGKAQDLSDGHLASRLERSRPWVADREQEALELVARDVISGLPTDLYAKATPLFLGGTAALESVDV